MTVVAAIQHDAISRFSVEIKNERFPSDIETLSGLDFSQHRRRWRTRHARRQQVFRRQTGHGVAVVGSAQDGWSSTFSVCE